MAKAELPGSGPAPDLLFAWLSPIEQKVDRRLHPKTASVNLPATSPLVTKARSALRKTVRASHVNSLRNSERKAKGCLQILGDGVWSLLGSCCFCL